ncbi:DamX protein [Methylobacter tundripaludum]|uniref:DamX protein n=2 Tax=Methylobacter tundripaludum TaxID=173365 RepID=A0A2S6GXV9_9GAMM|nr:DamX protein [Methylobacter tundripaludum]
MVEDDDVLWIKQPRRDPANEAVHSLITKERMQKLDLLIHLLSNLTQALVVCGPKGIGKTTLLNVLQERKTESRRYCLMQGNADLSFEAIYEQLARVRSPGQYKQIVLIVDNAGELVPGLITAVIQYAAANPVLRVIFALTHDELQMKRGSDRAVDDCHIVEIPPLSERQCGDFLQHLSTKPSLNLPFDAIGENMIEHIYRETHGVPGRIIAEVSGLPVAKPGGKLKWMFVITVAAAIAIVFGIQLLTTSKKDDKTVAPAPVQQKTDIIDIPPPPRTETPIMLDLSTAGSDGNAASGTTAPVQEVGQRPNELPKEPVLPAAQPVIPQPVQAAPANAIEPAAGVNTGVGAGQAAVPAAQPETPIKPPEQPSAEKAPDARQQQVIEPPVPVKPEVKAPSEPVPAVDQPLKNKQAAAQRAVEQEKTRQAQLKKLADSFKPFTPNGLETIQIPEKPVEIAPLPGGAVVETLVPRQVETNESLAQSANNFTLQLMVLSKQSSVDGLLRKYPEMSSGFRTINTIANGQQKFILVYGSYSDMASANKARQSLPFEFRKALVRKMSAIKQ